LLQKCVPITVQNSSYFEPSEDTVLISLVAHAATVTNFGA